MSAYEFVGVLVGNDRATPATAITASAVVILISLSVTARLLAGNAETRDGESARHRLELFGCDARLAAD